MRPTRHLQPPAKKPGTIKETAGFPVVGVGASAGGLEAFSQLLKELPADTGMGFVLVQHLDPAHTSALPKILALRTVMPVIEVTNGVTIEPNKVYVIPENTSMTIAQGVLRLKPRSKKGFAHMPIDVFLESLAEDQQERAIGVILSGTANDGIQGLETIKSEGGITFAQDSSAKFDSMPRSAIAAGCVDFVLSPQLIAKELGNISRKTSKVGEGRPKVRTEVRTKKLNSRKGVELSLTPEDAFQRILVLLRNHCGVDFSLYKPNTIHRRIARRMVLGHKEGVPAYLDYLNENEKELDLLYLDVLIGVTSFFRNAESYDVLKKQVFPSLVNQMARRDEPVRVWVAGCSTGQEAYSVAMAFTEYCDEIPHAPKLQIFATDLNEIALQKARWGLYSRAMLANLSPKRLERFFSEEQGGARINKSLRDSCVFARQNIISDPPFSKMDLIVCRNVMIYIELELQKKIMPNFHFALKPGGFLLLGGSESIGAYTYLFETIDKKSKIYRRKTVASAFNLLGSEERRGHLALSKAAGNQGPASATSGGGRNLRGEMDAQRVADRVASSRFSPPSVLIDFDFQVIQFRGSTGPYLQTPPGKPTSDLLKMAREGLMLPLRTALNKAKKENKPVRATNLRVSQNGSAHRVNIEVAPLREMKSFLVFFEESEKGNGGLNVPTDVPSRSRRENEERSRISELETELAETRAYLQSIQEQHESTNEELQAANDEAQSSNEELQSSNEELETSKEELESTNEELITVNEEMASRNTELSHLNSDLLNLQVSSKLAIILLGRDLKIRRFSPQATRQFKLELSDVGRCISSVRHNLDIPNLEDLIAEVTSTAQEKEREVQDNHGCWFSLRVRPYMTGDSQVDGAVIVLVDIDDLKRKESLIIEARARAEAAFETIPDPLVILNETLRVHTANAAFYRSFKLSPGAVEGKSIFDLPSWDIPKLRQMIAEVIPRNSFFNDLEVIHKLEGVGSRTLLINARPLSNSDQRSQILMGIRDITEVLAFQVQIRQSELRYRRLFEAANDGVLLIDPLTRKIIGANPFIADLLGYTREELCGKELFEVGLLKDRRASEAAFRQLQSTGHIRYDDLPLETKTGEKREVEFVSNLYSEDGEKIVQCNIRDITERRLAEQKFRSLLESAPDGMVISDRQGKIVLINAQMEKMFGYSREELFGQEVEILVPHRFRMAHPGHRAEFYKGPRPRQMGLGLPLAGLRKDGTEFSVEISLSPVEAGQDEFVIAAIRDITERKKSEEALRRSEERYRTLFTSMDEGFCIVEMMFNEEGRAVDFTFIDVNPSFEKQTGIQGAPGKKMCQIVPNLESFWFDTYGKVADTGEGIRFVQEAKALNRWFDVYAFRLDDPRNHKVAILFKDVTDNKVAEQQLRIAQSLLVDRANKLEWSVAERTMELIHKNKELEAFVYSVAHDLRAPLRSMQGFSDMLIEEAGTALSEDARGYARRIGASAQALDALLRDLIAFSGIAEQKFELSPLNLRNVAMRTVGSLKPDIEEKHATVEIIGDWPDGLCHEETLKLVLTHLIHNALRFVGPNVRPMVRLRTESSGEFVRVWVEDNGVGIDPAHQEQIFKLFTRLHGDKFGGTGIGLAMVKKGIERNGGQVGLESAPGQGSRFWIELKKANS